MFAPYIAFGIIVFLIFVTKGYEVAFHNDFGENIFILGREERSGWGCVAVIFGLFIASEADYNNPPVFNLLHGLAFIILCWHIGCAVGCFCYRRRIEENYARLSAAKGFRKFTLYTPPEQLPVSTPTETRASGLEYKPAAPAMPDEDFIFDPRRFDKQPRSEVKNAPQEQPQEQPKTKADAFDEFMEDAKRYIESKKASNDFGKQ